MTSALRVCIVGKYPPIEGGVSSTTYQIARDLAREGHEVQVVTSSDTVPDRYRMRLEPGDRASLQPTGLHGGSVTVHQVEHLAPQGMFHIPPTDPVLTRLAGRTTEVVRRTRSDVILAYYLEPYGMAGWFAAARTGVPLVLKHAGSDLDRLAARPDLAAAYREILRDAAAVVTRPALFRRFAGMGVDPARLVRDPGTGLDRDVFVPDGPVLALEPPAEGTGMDGSTPVIGVYGKIGVAKGTFDLVAALGEVARRGVDFRFVAMVGDAWEPVLRPHLQQAGIADRTTVLPFLPSWRVPEMVRACTAVCFLERDFPVAIHGPLVASEVLACGTCLVVSDEIADKQLPDAERGVQLHAVDPRDRGALADVLVDVLSDPEGARRTGKAGAALLAARLPVASEHGWADVLADAVRPAPRASVTSALEVALPGLVAHVRTHAPELLEEFAAAHPDPTLPGCALAWCAHLAATTPRWLPATSVPAWREALRYQVARTQASFHDDDVPCHAVADDGGGVLADEAGRAALYPVRSPTCRVERFTHDVADVFAPWPGAPDEATAALDAATARPVTVLFTRRPELNLSEVEVNDATLALLELCDGTRTTADLATELTRRAGVDVAPGAAADAVAQLYRAGAVVLGRRDPVWGWRGGWRSEPAPAER